MFIYFHSYYIILRVRGGLEILLQVEDGITRVKGKTRFIVLNQT